MEHPCAEVDVFSTGPFTGNPLAVIADADGLTTEQWEKMIVAHPSLCEMVREAALDAFGKSVHK